MKINYIILIPSSEGKKTGGDESKIYRVVKNNKKNNYFMKDLWIERENIYGKLRETISEMNFDALEKILDLKGNNLKIAIEKNEDLLNQETLVAIERFSGVMFQAINYKGLNDKEKNLFNRSAIIVDALFGLLKPEDLIPDFKLKLSSKLKDLNLIDFWKVNLKPILSKEFEGKIVIDILPDNFRKTIPSDLIEINDYVRVKFMENKSGKTINVGHNSKQLKGEFIRYLLKKENINRDYLENFKHSAGYIFDKDLSDEKSIIYVKN